MNTEKAIKATANSYQKGKAYFKKIFSSGNIPKCSPGFIAGACSGGHKFAAPYLCGKEYCTDCGRDGSPIHQRRFTRWLPYAQQFKKLGYLVVTMPQEYRWILKEKTGLTDFRYQLRRKLTRDKITAGLMRYHFYGDCTSCTGKGCKLCNDTGSGNTYHPHLNILFESGYISDLETWLDSIKRWQRNYIKKAISEEIKKRTLLIEKYGEAISNIDNVYQELAELNKLYDQAKNTPLVIHYSYTKDAGSIINKIKYVTRSTHRVLNRETKEHLFNFRNSIRWGLKPIKNNTEPIFCDVCQEAGHQHPVKWHKLEKYTLNTKYKHNEQKPGIYRMAEASDGGGRLFQFNTPRNTAADTAKIPRRYFEASS